jgi:hypothetical protein
MKRARTKRPLTGSRSRNGSLVSGDRIWLGVVMSFFLVLTRPFNLRARGGGIGARRIGV